MALRGADLEEAVRLIREADLLLVGLAGVVLMFGIWLRAVRWRILLKPLGKTTLTQSFAALTIGYLANNALPARLGEIVRVVILHRDAGIPRAGSLGTILVERLLDVLTLLLLLGVAAIASGWQNPWAGAFGLAGVGAVVGLAVTYAIAVRAVMLPGWLERRWRPWRAGSPQWVVEVGAGFLAGFANVASAGAMARVLLLSLASWMVEASVYFLVMRAMEIRGGAWMAMLVSSLSNLAGVIPAGPANLGPFEYFATETLLGFELSAEVAVAFVVAAHLLIIVPPSVIGGLLLLRGGFRGGGETAAR